jgi:holo-[acyl-carrier protein] synthase
MILGIGTDLLDVARMTAELEREKGGLLDSAFTPSEIRFCEERRYPARHFAARFAAKEAFLKALGGAGTPGAFLEVEVEREGDGPPRLVLHGRLREAAARLGVERVHVSLSHTNALASASVVLEGEGPRREE